MAKKVRKPSAANPRTYSQMPSSTAAPAVAATAVSTPTASVSKSSNGSQAVTPSKTVDLAAEYSVVGRELRRLLVTAAIMFLVLIAVNVVLTLIT